MYVVRTGCSKKIAQSLCITILQQYVRVMQFSAKCSERNWFTRQRPVSEHGY